MGILDHVFRIEGRSKAAWDDYWYTPLLASSEAKSGVAVNRDTAMRVSAVFSCVRIIAESVASLPCHLYRRLPDGGKERATDHWAHRLIHQSPNPRMSAYQWMETLVYHMTLTGNAYSEKQINNAAEVMSLLPWNPDETKIERSDRGDLVYKLRQPDGEERIKRAPDMIHVPGMAWDGVRGLSPIAYARESIGLGIAAEEFGARFYSSGTNVGTVYSLPEGSRLQQEQVDKLLGDLRAAHAGLEASHHAMLLPHGITASKVSIPPDDAQFLETRKFQVEEIARIYRVPLHMIQSETKSTSWGTGIESMSRGFVIYTLRPWLCRIEQTLNRSLLSESERENYFFEFLVDALLRGDQQARAEYYSTAIQNMWMTPNEVRERENMNPVDGGDDMVKPANIFGGSNNEPMPPEENSRCDCGHEHRAEPSNEWVDHPRLSIQRSYRRVIRDAMARVIRRERNDIMAGAQKAIRKGIKTGGEKRAVDALADFIAEFYTRHEEFTREQIRPAFTALAEAIGAEAMREIGRKWEWNDELDEWLEEYIAAFANRHSNQSRGQLLQLLDELEDETGEEVDDSVILNGLGQRFEEWEVGLDGGRPRDDKIGARESIRLGNGFARAAFFAAGVSYLVWRNTGSETCGYCKRLNGRRVGKTGVFIKAGEEFVPEGGGEPLIPHSDIGHPSAHPGCDCLIVPE